MIYVASLVEDMADKLEGYMFIHSPKELDKILLNKTGFHKVIVRTDFVKKFFTPTGIANYIHNAAIVNRNIKFELQSDSNDIITLNKMKEKIKKCLTPEELIDLIVRYGYEFVDILDNIILTSEVGYNELLAYSNQVGQLQNVINEMKVENDNLKEQLNEEVRNKQDYQSKFDLLIGRINYQYNKNMDKKKMFKVSENRYDKILYIKEGTRVQYLDSLVTYLQEILKIMFDMPARVVVIEPYFADDKIRQYPNLKPHTMLIQKDVLQGDILMLRFQYKIMEDILKNATKTSILIVVDRGGMAYHHIDASNVEYLYTYSDLNDKPEAIPNDRCISYSEDTLSIPYIKGFDVMGGNERINVYSSMPVMKSIIKLLEKRK